MHNWLKTIGVNQHAEIFENDIRAMSLTDYYYCFWKLQKVLKYFTIYSEKTFEQALTTISEGDLLVYYVYISVDVGVY